MNILALAAHPDDVEICVGGTLKKYRDSGHDIYIALTTSGNQGSNTHATREEIATIREKEQLEAAAMLNAKVRFMRFNDQGLFDTPETRKAVIEAIRWARPSVIFTHWPDDPSTDHGVTGKVVSEVMLSLPGKLILADVPPLLDIKPSTFYFEPAAGIGFLPEAYVDISKEWDFKFEMLKKHRSQVAWMTTNVLVDNVLDDLCSTKDKFRGLQVGCRYAEAFRAYRLHGYMPNFKLLP